MYNYFSFFLSMLENLTKRGGMLYIYSNYPTLIFNENFSTDFCSFSHCMLPSLIVICCWFSTFCPQWISSQQYHDSFWTSLSVEQRFFVWLVFRYGYWIFCVSLIIFKKDPCLKAKLKPNVVSTFLYTILCPLLAVKANSRLL